MYEGLIVFFRSEDIERTHGFYNGLCGLKLYLEQAGCRIYSVEGGGKIGFCGHFDPEPGDSIITLVTDKVDFLYQKFRNAGVEIENKPRINEKYGIYHFFARDPDGHRVEIQKFLWEEYYGGKPED